MGRESKADMGLLSCTAFPCSCSCGFHHGTTATAQSLASQQWWHQMTLNTSFRITCGWCDLQFCLKSVPWLFSSPTSYFSSFWPVLLGMMRCGLDYVWGHGLALLSPASGLMYVGVSWKWLYSLWLGVELNWGKAKTQPPTQQVWMSRSIWLALTHHIVRTQMPI